jgi:hypothetical protein
MISSLFGLFSASPVRSATLTLSTAGSGTTTGPAPLGHAFPSSGFLFVAQFAVTVFVEFLDDLCHASSAGTSARSRSTRTAASFFHGSSFFFIAQLAIAVFIKLLQQLLPSGLAARTAWAPSTGPRSLSRRTFGWRFLIFRPNGCCQNATQANRQRRY